MSNSKGLLLIVLLFSFSIFGRIYGDQNSVIKWEPVYGAGGYIVEVIDSDNTTVMKRETKDNSLDVGALPLGIYKYRITTLNKLKEEGGNTGWLTLTIKKEDIPQDINVASDKKEDASDKEEDVADKKEDVTDKKEVASDKKEDVADKKEVAADKKEDSIKESDKESADKYFKMYFALGIGWEYNVPLSSWSDQLNNSYKGINLYLSFPVSVIRPVRNVSFISSMDVEVQSSLVQYGLANENMSSLYADQSYSVYGFHAGLNYPISLDAINPNLKLIFNLDPGLSYSKYSGEFRNSINSSYESFEYTSLDFSLITGATARYFWTKSFFTDVSAQYNRIFYISHPLNDIKFILRIGIYL